MLRNLFNKFQNERPNPTGDWPTHSPQTPIIDLEHGSVGPLRFGDALDSAIIFGKPTSFEWHSATSCSLIYAEAGFQLDFELGRFVYAAWFIGPDEFAPKLESLHYSQPLVNGAIPLSSDTTVSRIEAAFGDPASRDDDEEETILFYQKHALIVEFECTPTGTLKRLNIFPSGS